MHIFYHHIYEYKKGVRNMILCTLPSNLEEPVVLPLKKNGISYMIKKIQSKVRKIADIASIFKNSHICFSD